MSQSKIPIVYVTSSAFKEQENEEFIKSAKLDSGESVSDLFEFEIRKIPIKEVLEVDLSVMVQAEVINAYAQPKVSCIVEHAGLIFKDYINPGDPDREYPGGLTKAMWNALQNDFLQETNSAKRPAIARAAIAYCDGMSVMTFIGETEGVLADSPRGAREFYWDTIFVPDATSADPHYGKTYAEIVEDKKLGLSYKMDLLSQSGRAMKRFLKFMCKNPNPRLWP